MDLSPEFIKMCGETEEIQDHAPEAGDCYFAQGEVVLLPMGKHIKGFCSYECLYLAGEEEITWLPRQDQLQEMIALCTDDLYKSFVKFCGYAMDEYEWLKPEYEKYSWEQLWLTLVMKKLYSKTWNGEDWIKEG